MVEKTKKKLGEILVEDGVLSPENLDEALLQQKKEGGVIGQILIRLGYVSEENLIAALSKQLTIPYISINQYAVNMDAVKSFDYHFCRQNMTIVFDQDDQVVHIATADPLSDIVIEMIEKKSGKRAQVFISTPTEIVSMLDLAFSSDGKDKPK